MMNGASFSMVNREEVRQAMGAPKQPSQLNVNLIGDDVSTALTGNEFKTKEVKTEDYVQAGLTTFTQLLGNATKKLKADVIIYGAIMGQGDNLKVTIEASRNNRTKDNVAYAKGNLIKTPDVASLLQGTVAPPTRSNPVLSSNTPVTGTRPITLGGGSDVTPFKHNNLTFEIVSCQQSGRSMECILNIVSTEVDADLWLYFNNTRIIDANGGHEFHVQEMKLADASSTNYRVGKTLISDVPIVGILRFNDISRQITSIAKMQINCYNFTAQLNNIPVN
jgi:hypothetical protein